MQNSKRKIVFNKLRIADEEGLLDNLRKLSSISDNALKLLNEIEEMGGIYEDIPPEKSKSEFQIEIYKYYSNITPFTKPIIREQILQRHRDWECMDIISMMYNYYTTNYNDFIELINTLDISKHTLNTFNYSPVDSTSNTINMNLIIPKVPELEI